VTDSRRNPSVRRLSGVLLVALLVGLAPAGQGSSVFARQSAPLCGGLPAAPRPEPAEIVTSAAATPAASRVASPVATPVAGVQASVELAAQIDHTVRVVAACQSEGDIRALVKIVTEEFLADLYAGGGKITRAQMIALADQLPQIEVAVRVVSGVTVNLDNSVSAEVESLIGRQLVRARWSFTPAPISPGDATGEDDRLVVWRAGGVTALPVTAPETANITRLQLRDHAYEPKNPRVNGPDIVLRGANNGKQAHEILVLEMGRGTEVSDLLTYSGVGLPPGITVLGQVTLAPGEKGEIVLLGMARGSYAIVDLLPDPTGTPHLALGMEATLSVR
jgi:hypothetical protein